MKGLQVSVTRKIKNAKDAMHYCILECTSFHDGCAINCKIRKYFKIPPHGPKYPEE